MGAAHGAKSEERNFISLIQRYLHVLMIIGYGGYRKAKAPTSQQANSRVRCFVGGRLRRRGQGEEEGWLRSEQK